MNKTLILTIVFFLLIVGIVNAASKYNISTYTHGYLFLNYSSTNYVDELTAKAKTLILHYPDNMYEHIDTMLKDMKELIKNIDPDYWYKLYGSMALLPQKEPGI